MGEDTLMIVGKQVVRKAIISNHSKFDMICSFFGKKIA